MTQHRAAWALTCKYRWETIDGKPRVVEHWTSDGEHYHYVYDFTAGISQVTDVLGTAEFRFNKDHRVIASQDFGGERYGFDLDATGNMTGIDLPDGNRVTMVYDEFGRLTEETDPIGRGSSTSITRPRHRSPR